MRKKVEALQERLAAANAKVNMWERFMQQMLGCVILSPDMNDMYKTECSALIRQVRRKGTQLPGYNASSKSALVGDGP